MEPNAHDLRGQATACKLMDMSKRRSTGTMTELLREALLAATSLNAIQKATGVRRQTLAAFMRREQRSIHLASADKLAQYFGIVCSHGQTTHQKGGL
jgi:plasmid maintenance system antidote protein VapI